MRRCVHLQPLHFKCDHAQRLGWWLNAHEIFFAQAVKHQRSLVFQLERLLSDPDSVLDRIGSFLAPGHESLNFSYLWSQRQLGLHKGSVIEDGRVSIASVSVLFQYRGARRAPLIHRVVYKPSHAHLSNKYKHAEADEAV